ncbi:MAG: hypothetical protein LBK07_06855, partial [Tannerella sp.]|nr:hypothetical protein [Tannerella sp.]
TEISNLGSIYFKSPNSCSYQSFSLGGGGGALPGGLPRAVTIPAVSGVTMYPFTTGVHRVESGRDFVFTIRVNDPSLKPNVGTDRNRPEGEDVTVTPAGDGVYEIVVQTVNSALKLTIELVPIGAGIEATEGSSVWSAGGQIHATSVTPATADIYSVAGAAVTRLALGAGETAVTSLPAGVYFVRMSGKVYKVVVE